MTTPASLLNPDAFLSPLAIDEAAHRALDEDLGRAGDITSMATIPEATHAHAVMIARQAGVVTGLPQAGARTRAIAGRASGQDRDRGRYAGAVARGARHRPRRRGAAGQYGNGRSDRGGETRRRTRGAGGFRRRHPGFDREDRRDG